jgi:hypothetical protein
MQSLADSVLYARGALGVIAIIGLLLPAVQATCERPFPAL